MSFFTRDAFKKVSNAPDNADSLIALLEPYEPYIHGDLPIVFPLTGKFQFSQLSYDSSKEKDNYKSLFHNRICYFNVKWANKFWGFYHKSKAEVSREADRISAVGSNPKFEFYAWAGQTLYANPQDGKFTYKRASAFLQDKICGPGMVRTIKDSTQEFPQQNFANFTDV